MESEWETRLDAWRAELDLLARASGTTWVPLAEAERAGRGVPLGAAVLVPRRARSAPGWSTARTARSGWCRWRPCSTGPSARPGSGAGPSARSAWRPRSPCCAARSTALEIRLAALEAAHPSATTETRAALGPTPVGTKAAVVPAQARSTRTRRSAGLPAGSATEPTSVGSATSASATSVASTSPATNPWCARTASSTGSGGVQGQRDPVGDVQPGVAAGLLHQPDDVLARCPRRPAPAVTVGVQHDQAGVAGQRRRGAGALGRRPAAR